MNNEVKNQQENLPREIVSGPKHIAALQGITVQSDAKGSNAHYYLSSDGEYFTKMKTTFRVPGIPKDASGSYWLYLWPGIQSSIGGVLQPVLAYHNNHQSWYLHTYAISPDGNSHEQGVDYDVEVGIELTGVIELLNNKNDLYTYKVYFEGYPENTSCTQTWDRPPVYAYELIEPWYVNNAQQFPAEGYLVMYNIELYTNTNRKIDGFTWGTNNSGTIICDSEKVAIPYWNGLN